MWMKRFCIAVGKAILLCSLFSNTLCSLTKQELDADNKKGPLDHVEGVIGERVEMPCDISVNRRDDSVYMVLWFRESAGKPLYSFDVRGRGMKTAKTWSSKTGFDKRAAFQAASYPAHLLVSDLKISDQGVYRCRVDFRHSRTRNSLVNLTVAVPPTTPIIYDGSDEEVETTIGPFVEGSDVLLKCRVRGGRPEPMVSWFLNEALIDSTYYVNGYGDVVNEMLFQRINRSHLDSQFTCKASNTRLVKPVEKSVHLDLNLKPLFVQLHQKNTDRVIAGREYRVSCETAGSKPTADLRWFKAGVEITSVNIQESDGGNVTKSGFVFIPTPTDHGLSIICRAENPKLNGTHVLEETWFLNVVYVPEVKLSLGSTLKAMEIKEGTDVYFECKIQANPKITKLAWLLNDEELKHNVSAGIIMSNQSLVLQGINRNQNGNYCCIATNAEGSSRSNFVPLSVMYTPVCLAGSGVTVGATKGESIGLRCAVESNPTAYKFEWEFHGSGDSIDVVPVGKVVSEGDLSRFFYTPQNDLEFGTFLCWGANTIGRQVQPCVFHVVVAVKPHPLENCSVVNLNESTIHVECSKNRELPTIPDQPLIRIMNEIRTDTQQFSEDQEPNIYGTFPEYYVMEVWDIRNRSIRRNMSSEIPVFNIKGLGSGSWIRLILYAANSHGRSELVTIEAAVPGDADKLNTGERKSQIEFYPLVAIGVGVAVAGTLFILTAVVTLRSRHFCLTSSNPSPMRSNGTNSHCEKSPHATSLLSQPPSLLSDTSHPSNSSVIEGYRSLPQSKSEADTNPDIIPGANSNSFPTEFEDIALTSTHRNFHQSGTQAGIRLSSENYQSRIQNNISPHSGTLYQCAPTYSNSSLDRRFPPHSSSVHCNNSHYHSYHMSQNNGNPPSSELSPLGSRHHQHDYNTIYIRDKLLCDSEIPESCV